MSLMTSTDPRDLCRQQLGDKWCQETEVFPNADRDKSGEAFLSKTDPVRRDRNQDIAPVCLSAATTGKAVPSRLGSVTTCVVTILGDEHGHLDTQGTQRVADQLGQLVDSHNVRHLLMDLGRIESFTAHFLHMLAELRTRLTEQNRRIGLCHVRPLCAMLLQTSGLPNVIKCYDSTAQALAVAVFPPDGRGPAGGQARQSAALSVHGTSAGS